jgi:tetratricopeptide (TPR) repeat protein
MLGAYLTYAGRDAEAERRFAEVIEHCTRVADDFHHAAALLNRRMLWLRLDRLEEAEDDLRRAIEIARRHGAAQLERLANLNLAETLYWKSDLDGAQERAERAASLRARFSGADFMSDDALILARVHLARGDRAAAEVERRRAGAPSNPKASALARLIDLVLAQADHDAWCAAERELFCETTYAEIAIEFYLWAARTALASGQRDFARDWLQKARDRGGAQRAWEKQLSHLALHVGE